MKKRDIDLLFEVGALRRMPRMWIHFLGSDLANNAEHSFRVAWTALLIAKEEGEKDIGRVLQMALVHDLTEGRTGDANYLMRQYVKRDDELAGQDIFADTALEQEMLAILQEYRDRKTLVSKIVKDADTLDVDLELREAESQGKNLPADWVPFREKAIQSLYTDGAKRIAQASAQGNPHDWHTKSRNRFVGGDYSDTPAQS